MNKVSLIKSIHELQHALRLCGSADNRADNHLQEEKITMEKFIAVHSADGLSEGLINTALIEMIEDRNYYGHQTIIRMTGGNEYHVQEKPEEVIKLING